MAKETSRLDQGRRAELCRAVLAGDRHAQVALASLYHDAGMPCMARIILGVTRSQAKNHARAVLNPAPERTLAEIMADARRVLRK